MPNGSEKVEKREVGEKVQIHAKLEPSTTKELGEGIIDAIVTTADIDRTNERIDTPGIDTDNYMEKNPVVLYGHSYFGLPIGKTIKLVKMKTKIKARFQLAIEEYPFAETVYQMIKGGYLNAVSIGGRVLEWSEDYKEILQMEMLEFSVVPIPANPQAVITGRSFEETVGKSIDEVKKEYLEFNRLAMLDKTSDMSDTEIKQSIKTLESLIGILKESTDADSFDGNDEERRIKRIRISDAAKSINRESERTIRLIKTRR